MFRPVVLQSFWPGLFWGLCGRVFALLVRVRRGAPRSGAWGAFALCAALALGAPEALQAQVSVSASLQPPSTTVGEPVQLHLTINGSQRVDQIPAIRVEGAQVQHIGQNTQIQLINAQLTVSLTHRFLVSPQRIGELEIPAVEVLVGGQTHRTEPLKLRVLDVGQNPGANPGANPGGNPNEPPTPAPSAEIQLPQRPVYVGESFPAEVRLLVPNEIRWRIERMPEFDTDAFTKTPFQQPQQRQENREGRTYDVCNFRTTLTAIKSGRVPLGPLTFNIQAAQPRKRAPNPGNPFAGFFDGFPFDNQPTVLQEKKVVLPQQHLEIRELPTEGKPDSFTGGIGRFRFSASVSQTKVKAGEPLLITLQVEGEGNFDRIEPPKLIDPDGWRAYPPEINFTKSDDTGMRGVKTFRIALVPEKPHTRTPQFEFASFDPEAGSYQRQQNGISPLTVEGLPEPEPAPKVVSKTPEAKPEPERKPEPQPEPKTVLAAEPTPVKAVSGFWESRTWFWGLQIAGGVLLTGVCVGVAVRSVRARQGPGPRLLREAALLERQLASESDRSTFFAKAIRSLQLRVEALTGQPAAATAAPDVIRAFAPGGDAEAELRWLFEMDAAARFSGRKEERPLREEERQRVQTLLSRCVSRSGV